MSEIPAGATDEVLDDVRRRVPTVDIEVRESEVLVVPGTGTVVNLKVDREVAVTLQDVRHLEGELREVKRVLTEALVASWAKAGTAKTFTVGGGRTVEITGGPVKVYDAEAIRDELLAAGMAEERVSEIVVETVSYQVKAVEATRAAKANPVYAEIIARNTSMVERPYLASVKGRE